jgi:acyl-coenzyme A synthetase/AMP-(fatty) acid ligase
VRLVEEGEIITECNIPAEIYVSSNALADGYYNDSERTAESFVDMDGKRWYKTGDIARYDENGDLIFASRRDFQIKHMGHRIELGEIETVALTIDGIALCCCLYDKKHSRICLYCETDGTLCESDILEALKSRLVSYMLPHRILISDALPKNQNGKIDRAALNMTLNKGV